MPEPVVAEATTPENPQLQAHLDAMTSLRQHGYSWDQISQYYGQQVQRLRAAGYDEGKIRAYYGGQDPTPDIAGMQSRMQQTVQAQAPKNALDAFVGGLTNSSSAALQGVAPRGPMDTSHSGWLTRFAGQAGEVVGDLPAMAVGGAVGGVLGGGGGAVGGATAGGGPEDVPADVVGAGAGAAIGAGAGAMGLPQLIKSERDAWIKAMARGWNPRDFLAAQGQVAKDTVIQSGIGALTGGVGGAAERALAKVGVGGLAATGGKLAAEGTTMVGAQSALEGHLPTTQDLVDGAILLAAFHTAGKASGAAMRAYRARLAQNYVETGQMPMEAAEQAKLDPVKRRELMGGPNPPARPGSGRSEIGAPPAPQAGHLPTGAPPADQFVVPRVAGHFDEAVNFTLEHEGGAYVIDANGKGVKWGINAADNPGVDVPHLSRDDAAEIYKHKYWDAIGADHLAPDMRLAAFDTAVVEGVARAKQWLAESNGDPKVFLGKRAAFEAQLAQRDPAKYGRFVKAWGNRIRDLGGHSDSAALVSRDPTNPLSPNEERLIANEGLPEPPEPPEKPPAPPNGGPGDEDGQHWDRVMGRVADAPGGKNLWGDTVQTAQGIYRDLFNRGHPIDKLMDAVTQGGDLDDADNPLFLRRLAENTDELSKYAIERKMIDLDGNETGKSLKEIVEGVGDAKTQKRFIDGYAMARWAGMMADQGKETGVNALDAGRVVAEGHDQFEAAFQELVGWRNGTLRWLGEGGVHAQSKVDKLIAENEAAIPGYRDMGDGKWAPGAPGQNVWNPVKAAKGSERKVQPILHSLMQDAFLRRALAMTNRANVALVDAAKGVGLASEKRAVDINVVRALADLHAEGIDEDTLTSLARSTGQMVPKDQVPIFRDGKLYGASFDAEFKDVVPVLRGYDQGPRSTVMKVAAAIASVPRRLQTVGNPIFPVKLLTYDLPWQFITNPDAKGPLQNFIVGLGHVTGNTPLYDQWLRSGGAERVFQGMSHDAYLKSVFKGDESESLAAGAHNLVKSAWHGLTAWAGLVSQPLRVGRYARGLAAGESPQRAAVASTEAAFHRPGFGGVTGRAWNTLVPYLTAHLNGLEKTARAQFGIGETVTGVKYNWAATTAKAFAVLTLPALAQWWFNKDQEWYKAAPDWKKDNGFFIPVGSGHMFIAAPPLISALYIGIPRRLAEAFINDNPHAADGFGESFGASLMPPGGLSAASFLQPFIEHLANFSFFKDQPLVNPDTLKGVGPAEQYNHYSSGLARGVARFASDIPLLSAMKLSPPVIDNYIRFWAGEPGQLALRAADAVAGASNPNQPPAQSFADWPGVSSWVARYPSASAQSTQDFYTRSDQLDQVHGSLTAAMRDGDVKRFQELAERDPSAAAYHMMRFQDEPSSVDTGPYITTLAAASDKADWQDLSLIKEGQGAMKQASLYARKVWESPQLTAQDKRQILDQTYATMQVIAERTTEAMDRARIGGSRPSSHAPAAPASLEFTPPDERVQ